MEIHQQQEAEALRAYIRDFASRPNPGSQGHVLARALIAAGKDRVADIPGWICGTYLSRVRETLTHMLDSMIASGHFGAQMADFLEACGEGSLSPRHREILTALQKMIPHIHVNYSEIMAEYGIVRRNNSNERRGRSPLRP